MNKKYLTRCCILGLALLVVPALLPAIVFAAYDRIHSHKDMYP